LELRYNLGPPFHVCLILVYLIAKYVDGRIILVYYSSSLTTSRYLRHTKWDGSSQLLQYLNVLAWAKPKFHPSLVLS
jgi:hypothetical protein